MQIIHLVLFLVPRESFLSPYGKNPIAADIIIFGII